MRIISRIKDNVYLIIPALFVIFWAIYYFIKIRTFISYERYWDFGIYYQAGKQIFEDPSNLYNVLNFYYFPNTAIFFAVTISLFPLNISYYLFFILNIILGIFLVVEFDIVMKLMNLEKKIHRLIFLLIVSNGWFLHSIFTFNQTKLFVGLILIYIIRKELEFRKEKRERKLRNLLINNNLIIFAAGMAPSFILILFIYVFHNIGIKEVFKKKNVLNYCIIIMSFLIQNILFILFPTLISDFLSGYSWGYGHQWGSNCFLITIFLPDDFYFFYSSISTFILLIITIILVINRTLNFEIKMGYFTFSYLFFGMFSGFSLFHILIVLSLLIYIPYLEQELKFLKFMKKNLLLMISLLAIVVIILLPHILTINKYIPLSMEYPYNIFIKLRYIILFCFLGITSSFLFLSKKFNSKNIAISLLFVGFLIFMVTSLFILFF